MKVKLSSSNLFKILKDDTETLRIRDYEIDNSTLLDIGTYNHIKSVYFNNCTFLHSLDLNFYEDQEIRFYSCELQETSLSGLHANLKHGKLLFHDSSVQSFSMSDVSLTELKIYNSKFKEEFDVIRSQINGKLSLDKSIFYDGIEINGLVCSEKISISSCKIEDDFFLEQTTSKLIDIYKTTIEGAFYLTKASCDLNFSNLIANGDSMFEDCNIKNVNIESCVFNNYLAWGFTKNWQPSSVFRKENNASKYLIDSIQISSSSFIGGFGFALDRGEDQYLPIKRLELVSTTSTKGDIFLENLEIYQCDFKGYNKEGTFIFNNCLITDKMFFYRFINSGKIVFNGQTWLNTTNIFFQESIVGSVSFIASDFSTINYFNFYDSDISNITFPSTKWDDLKTFNKNYRINSNDPAKDELIYFENRRELFRQLKNSAERQNDRIQSLKFQQYEMMAYRKTLQLSGKSNVYDKIILALETTNNFGQHWAKPVVYAFGITFLLSIPFIIGLFDEIYLTSDYSKWGGGIALFFDKWWTVYPQLLNPIHNLEKLTVNPESIHKGVYWLDYLLKIIMAFFIFQTVSAFRKYVRKSG